jgi:hypothetical protein
MPSDLDVPPGGRFVVEDVAGVRTLVVTGPWSHEASEALGHAGADALVINYARGFEADLERGALEFLDPRFRVRRLHVLDRGIDDVSPIYRLRGSLEELSIQVASTASLDLAELPGLRRLSGEWSLIRPSLAAISELTEIITWRFAEPDLVAFEPHARLKRLTVKDAPNLESLDGLTGSHGLRHLEVRSARRLADISTLVEVGSSLEELVLEKCQAIESLKPVAAARRLQILKIGDCGDLPSAFELQGLDHLEELHAWGSTCFIDGDLSVLADLPALREIRMQDRRHYRPRVAALTATMSRRR